MLKKFKQDDIDLILSDIINNSKVQKMKDYIQHYDISCFEHCYNVARLTYRICKLFHLNYIDATRAAMLHDMFLYDWRVKSNSRKNLHGFRHPRIAMENASKEFDLTKKEKDIILKHMWPLTIIPPKSIEGFIVSVADKHVTIMETLEFQEKAHIFKYSYILWAVLLFRI